MSYVLHLVVRIISLNYKSVYYASGVVVPMYLTFAVRDPAFSLLCL